MSNKNGLRVSMAPTIKVYPADSDQPDTHVDDFIRHIENIPPRHILTSFIRVYIGHLCFKLPILSYFGKKYQVDNTVGNRYFICD